jgi:hypothetical protein
VVDFELMAVALLPLRDSNNSPLSLQMEVMCANLEKHPKSFPMINLTYPGVCVCVYLCALRFSSVVRNTNVFVFSTASLLAIAI